MRPLILILLFALLVISQINTIVDNDLWLHIKAGEYAVKNFSIPTVDIFSYTMGNKPWIHYDWLSEILFYIVFINFGLFGLNILKVLIIVLCFFVLRLIFPSKRNEIWPIFFIILSMFAFGYRSFVRPEMFSYLLLCIFLYILEKDNLVFILPFLQVIWVNTHGYFIAGPVLVFIYFIGAIFYNDRLKSKKIFLTLILVIASCFITPYFYKGIGYPLKIIQEAYAGKQLYMHEVQELMMPIRSSFFRYAFFWVFVVLSSLTFLINLKKARITHILIFLVSFTAAYSAARYMPLFIFTAVPFAAINMNERYLIKEDSLKKFYTAFIVIICFAGYLFLSNSYYSLTSQSDFKKTESRFSRLLIPSGACDFLEKNNIKGRMFNTLDFGPYIAYRFYPEKRIFIDTRIGLYKEDFYEAYRKAQNYPEEWNTAQKKYGFNIVLIRHLFAGSERILKYLYKSQRWDLAYYDANSVIFLRDMPEYKLDFSKKNMELKDINISIARFFENIGETKIAEDICVKLLETKPKFLEAANNLAGIYISTGRSDQALNLMFNFLEYYPKTPELYANIGTAYMQIGKVKDAEYMLERALRIDPYLRQASYMLGLLYMKQGNAERALRQFIKYKNLDPFNAEVCRFVGDIYKQKGLFKEAGLEYNEADKLEGR